jgi:hypothetical protein
LRNGRSKEVVRAEDEESNDTRRAICPGLSRATSVLSARRSSSQQAELPQTSLILPLYGVPLPSLHTQTAVGLLGLSS